MLPYTSAAPLIKRDEGYLLPKPVIILLIIIGAGLLVCVGFAVHSAFGFRSNGNGMKNMGSEQMEYMTAVRGRNLAVMMAQGQRSRMEGAGPGGVRMGESVYD
ncbi:hypothetical protein COCMIDRAFT_36815 [Bipolaris oryzae ATCC 44560]|uniref:Uncharacterized protein n=1 Tax=Bipolaris oryzae ATCC 44560 TaxID=930090 RepID=W6Z6J7_COCMI|nr:uncharacterized protein COCMIDRAFT_36815 [Bipolaris oryzae ATCC 44560]EUC45433.1 hypothetical protein COCMIDRAFT_36815 [Bipolaris oryzae ATCC 44560]